MKIINSFKKVWEMGDVVIFRIVEQSADENMNVFGVKHKVYDCCDLEGNLLDSFKNKNAAVAFAMSYVEGFNERV